MKWKNLEISKSYKWRRRCLAECESPPVDTIIDTNYKLRYAMQLVMLFKMLSFAIICAL